MEKQLGFQVFERHNKTVLLSPLGKQCLEKARKIKTQIDDLHCLGRAALEPFSYPMSLGGTSTIGPYLLPKFLPKIYRNYPDFRLRIIEEQSSTLVELIRKGQLDAAILALPYELDGLLAFEFMQEDFYWITHRDNHHAMQKEISSDKIHKNQLMLLRNGHHLKELALASCNISANETNTKLASRSLETLVQMVAGKMGTTLAPAMAIEKLLADIPELRAVHLNEPSPHRRIAFITRPNYPGKNNNDHLITKNSFQTPTHFKKPLEAIEPLSNIV